MHSRGSELHGMTTSAPLLITRLTSTDVRGVNACMLCGGKGRAMAAYVHRPDLGLRGSQPICVECCAPLEPLLGWLGLSPSHSAGERIGERIKV
jgi:hypothetical protein